MNASEIILKNNEDVKRISMILKKVMLFEVAKCLKKNRFRKFPVQHKPTCIYKKH